jgi:hypothetical protein
MNDFIVDEPTYELHINVKNNRASKRANELERIVSKGLNPRQWKIIKKELNPEKDNSYDFIDELRRLENKAILLEH